MEPIVSSETSAIRTQTPGNYPKRNKLHLEQGESLKTRLNIMKFRTWYNVRLCFKPSRAEVYKSSQQLAVTATLFTISLIILRWLLDLKKKCAPLTLGIRIF